MTYPTQNFQLYALITLLLSSLNLNAQQIGENYVIFEAEETESPLGAWNLITPENANYFNPPGGVAPINETYLEFSGNSPGSGNPNSPLEYTFVCPKTATYRIVMRMYQRLEGEPGDRCNDVWVKMTGNFTPHESIPYTQEDLEDYMKFYGGGINNWGVCLNGEGGTDHVHSALLYNLIEGEEYTFTMAGRSQRCNIDYLLFYENSMDLHIVRGDDLAANNPHHLKPRHFLCLNIKAVDFHSYKDLNGFTDASTDTIHELSVLKVDTTGAWSAARFVYEGGNGEASFNLRTMQEKAGESTYILKINNQEIARDTNDAIHGTATPNYSVQTHVFNDVSTLDSLFHGDTIQIEFNNTSNGLVEEEGVIQSANGIFIDLNLCTTGWLPVYEADIIQDEIALLLGESDTLNASVDLGLQSDTSIVWGVRDTAIISIDQNGIVTSKANGTTYAYITTNRYGLKDSCIVYSLGIGSGNIALHKPVIASSSDSHLPEWLVDGNLDDEARWSAQNYPQWAEIDLGMNHYIYRTELICTWDRAYQYTISVKETADSDSIVIIDRSTNSTRGRKTNPIVDYVVPNVQGRYIKIHVTGEGGNYNGSWISLTELRVYGGLEPDTSSPPPPPIIEPDYLNELMGSQVRVYPNPFTNELQIVLENDSYSYASLMDITGRVIMSEAIQNRKLKLSPTYNEVPAGMYLVRLSGKSGSRIIKVIREEL